MKILEGLEPVFHRNDLIDKLLSYVTDPIDAFFDETGIFINRTIYFFPPDDWHHRKYVLLFN